MRSSKITPRLTFSIYAWQKLMWLTNHTNLEFSCWGLTDPKDNTYITNVILCPQDVSSAHCEFRDAGIADLMDRVLAEGLQPKDIFRVWIHSHPTFSTTPSSTDWGTVDKLFKECDYGIMVIVNQSEEYNAILRQNGPFPTETDMTVYIDWNEKGQIVLDTDAWEKEYKENVFERIVTTTFYSNSWKGAAEAKKTEPAKKVEKDWDSDLGKTHDDFLGDDFGDSEYVYSARFMALYDSLEGLFECGYITQDELFEASAFLYAQGRLPSHIEYLLEEEHV